MKHIELYLSKINYDEIKISVVDTFECSTIDNYFCETCDLYDTLQEIKDEYKHYYNFNFMYFE